MRIKVSSCNLSLLSYSCNAFFCNYNAQGGTSACNGKVDVICFGKSRKSIGHTQKLWKLFFLFPNGPFAGDCKNSNHESTNNSKLPPCSQRLRNAMQQIVYVLPHQLIHKQMMFYVIGNSFINIFFILFKHLLICCCAYRVNFRFFCFAFGVLILSSETVAR